MKKRLQTFEKMSPLFRGVKMMNHHCKKILIFFLLFLFLVFFLICDQKSSPKIETEEFPFDPPSNEVLDPFQQNLRLARGVNLGVKQSIFN